MMPPRAYAFIFLNCVRILSIVALLLVFASNIVTLVNDIKAIERLRALGEAATKGTLDSASNATLNAMMDFDYVPDSTVPNQQAGAFWAVLNRLFIIFQAVILIGSELGFPSKLFATYFPVLGKEFGLGALGVIQMLIGAAILSHRVDTFTLVSAFFLFSVGCLNVVLGICFGAGAKSKRSVTSWREHAKSALPTHIGPVDVRPVTNAASQYMSRKGSTFSSPFSSPPPTFVSHLHTGSTTGSGDSKNEKAGYGYGFKGEKAAAMDGFFLNRVPAALPKYTPRPN